MAWNGSGQFTRNNGSASGGDVWNQDKIAARQITATLHDTHDEDLATGLENCVTRDGQNSPSADLPMSGYKHTNVGDATARTHYAKVSQIQDSSYLNGGTSTGAANNYAVNLSPVITSLVLGMRVRFIAHQANTTTCFLNLNGLGATQIRGKRDQVSLGEDAILLNELVEVEYDGNFWRLISTEREGWKTWFPTYSAGGSMTFTSVTTTLAKYQRTGNDVEFNLIAAGTTGGTADSRLRATMPINPTAEMEGKVLHGWTAENSASISAVTYITGVLIELRKYDATNYGLGVFRYLVASGRYRV